MRASRFCKVAHNGQVDRNGKPVYLHPYTVAKRVVDYCDNNTDLYGCNGDIETLEKIAYLHDVVEDTDYTIKEVKEKCDLTENEVVSLIAITRKNGEKYFDYIKRCAKDYDARFVKMRDLETNILRSSVNDKRVKERYLPALGYLHMKSNYFYD